MVLRVPISPETEAKLKAKALESGVDLETFVARHLEAVATPTKALNDVAPLEEGQEASDMTEDELADFIEKEIHAMRAERRAKQKDEH